MLIGKLLEIVFLSVVVRLEDKSIVKAPRVVTSLGAFRVP